MSNFNNRELIFWGWFRPQTQRVQTHLHSWVYSVLNSAREKLNLLSSWMSWKSRYLVRIFRKICYFLVMSYHFIDFLLNKMPIRPILKPKYYFLYFSTSTDLKKWHFSNSELEKPELIWTHLTHLNSFKKSHELIKRNKIWKSLWVVGLLKIQQKHHRKNSRLSLA